MSAPEIKPSHGAAPPNCSPEHLAKQRRLALDAITDFAYVFDLHGRFTFINKPLLDLWGLTLEQAVGKNFFELKYPAELAAKLQRQIQEVIQSKHRIVDETPYTNPAGLPGFYQYIFSPVINAEGVVEAVAGSTRDISDYKRLTAEREQLLQSERAAREEAETANRAKDKFIAVLSHELRTPLSPVVMTIPAMELDPELPFKLREDLAMIRRNIELEVKLIDDLLDLSRVTTGKLRLQMEPVSAHEVLRHALHSSLTDAAGKNLHIQKELNAKNDRLLADPARLQQVFWNLLRNAVKFTPENGTITIRTSNSADGAKLCVEIADSGVGIPADILPRIFDAFEQGDARVTRQFGGLGLGLAIAKAVVELHGGTIAASSQGHNRGATFTVTLNAAANNPTEDAPSAEGESNRAGKPRPCRILLVEDHPDTSRVMARILKSYGYEVQTANSVVSALNLAARESFDLLISDIGLPDATGYELMREIRRLYNIKGIALSGYGMEEDARKSRDAGFAEHLVKPINLPQLEAALRRVLNAEP